MFLQGNHFLALRRLRALKYHSSTMDLKLFFNSLTVWYWIHACHTRYIVRSLARQSELLVSFSLLLLLLFSPAFCQHAFMVLLLQKCIYMSNILLTYVIYISLSFSGNCICMWKWRTVLVWPYSALVLLHLICVRILYIYTYLYTYICIHL